jgi:hypothetical protein
MIDPKPDLEHGSGGEAAMEASLLIPSRPAALSTGTTSLLYPDHECNMVLLTDLEAVVAFAPTASVMACSSSPQPHDSFRPINFAVSFHIVDK